MTLRNKLIRLAYAKPQLRPQLVPLIIEGGRSIPASKRASRALSYRKVVKIINDDDSGNGSMAEGRKANPASKDKARLKKILLDGDVSREQGSSLKLALKQARSIKDWMKALRRGRAAESFLGNPPLEDQHVQAIATAFYSRALELLGLGKLTILPIKTKSKKESPEFTAPPIPQVPMTARGWGFDESIEGAEEDAKNFGEHVKWMLTSISKSISPYNSDRENFSELRSIMRARKDYRLRQSAFHPSAKSEAMIQEYVESYLDPKEFPNTLRVPTTYYYD